jgi:hypothetical protein
MIWNVTLAILSSRRRDVDTGNDFVSGMKVMSQVRDVAVVSAALASGLTIYYGNNMHEVRQCTRHLLSKSTVSDCWCRFGCCGPQQQQQLLQLRYY